MPGCMVAGILRACKEDDLDTRKRVHPYRGGKKQGNLGQEPSHERNHDWSGTANQNKNAATGNQGGAFGLI